MPEKKNERTEAEILADIDLKVAEAEKHRADARRANCDAVRLYWDSEEAKYSAEVAKLRLESKTRDVEIERQGHKEWLNTNMQHRCYEFTGPVTEASVETAVHVLTMWSRLYPGEDIEIVFHSPGGHLFDGLRLYDFIQYLKSKDHHVTTTTRGMAASMGGILLQAGTVRCMGSESVILFHEVTYGAIGKLSDVKDTSKLIDKVMDRVYNLIAARSSGKLTPQQARVNIERKDWWLDSTEALELGLVDKVV